MNIVQRINGVKMVDSRDYCKEVLKVNHRDWFKNTLLATAPQLAKYFKDDKDLRDIILFVYKKDGKYTEQPQYAYLSEDQAAFFLLATERTPLQLDLTNRYVERFKSLIRNEKPPYAAFTLVAQ